MHTCVMGGGGGGLDRGPPTPPFAALDAKGSEPEVLTGGPPKGSDPEALKGGPPKSPKLADPNGSVPPKGSDPNGSVPEGMCMRVCVWSLGFFVRASEWVHVC